MPERLRVPSAPSTGKTPSGHTTPEAELSFAERIVVADPGHVASFEVETL
ncbi:hypothetical protein SXIM_28470 [Streptomyces xiamenensis]|uniref:Uncharacterized protein n=1 Tax=Streptomyces xiamenensis TaxID=408015 RepID=A0A0F7CP87_9ACTN|nr:hypothetical protein SXIM_28470 [Streptomyces xiamenensis]